MKSKLSFAQLKALRFAQTEPIRFFKGGFYTNNSVSWVKGLTDGSRVPVTYVPAGTVRSLVERGLLDEKHADDCVCDGEIIYCLRWSLTEKGRQALAEVDR